ncbi:hypothetical protein CYMTET_28665 [Cymbomonas tetramitiformis]|uniref:Uncharacterized protein n=1 Tax=Cymbomonas tetramitiformis TaxID=36881 RepID=A0AAE0FMP0_9CHLO|nr:hypothetical protein CYMTET_28665 [Cymbomonas tetramitiformis]
MWIGSILRLGIVALLGVLMLQPLLLSHPSSQVSQDNHHYRRSFETISRVAPTSDPQTASLAKASSPPVSDSHISEIIIASPSPQPYRENLNVDKEVASHEAPVRLPEPLSPKSATFPATTAPSSLPTSAPTFTTAFPASSAPTSSWSATGTLGHENANITAARRIKVGDAFQRLYGSGSESPSSSDLAVPSGAYQVVDISQYMRSSKAIVKEKAHVQRSARLVKSPPSPSLLATDLTNFTISAALPANNSSEVEDSVAAVSCLLAPTPPCFCQAHHARVVAALSHRCPLAPLWDREPYGYSTVIR